MGGALQDEGTAVQKSTSLQRAVAGSLSGCVARFIIGPLDVIKIRFQVQLEPIKSAQSAAARHAASKYTGLGQALVTILKEEGIQGKLSDGRKFCMIIAFTYQGPLSRDEHPRIPTFRLPLPLSFSLSLSLSLKLECMMRASDLKGLWRGTVPGLLLTVPYTGVQFVALQHAKDTAAKLGLSGVLTECMQRKPLGSASLATLQHCKCATTGCYSRCSPWRATLPLLGFSEESQMCEQVCWKGS
eukprot:scaffold151036_cov20-Tisochrysis_lutea.AAC.1